MNLSTPPKVKESVGGEGPDPGKSKLNARRNLTRKTNRKANTSFAKELKDSLASGRPTNLKVPADQTDLKAAWHAAAKEVAYKFLDLTRESWKDYSIFEKSVVHTELKEAYNFDPPLDPKRVDKYLSCHLRTSRAVWKAHWKKYGAEHRHHNCPEVAWAKLTTWWPTTACQEEAAEMASRRARVEKTSNVGRSSLLERMDGQVRSTRFACDLQIVCFRYFALNVCAQGPQQSGRLACAFAVGTAGGTTSSHSCELGRRHHAPSGIILYCSLGLQCK